MIEKIKNFFISIYERIAWFLVKPSRRVYEAVDSSMPSLIGMKLLTGKPKANKLCVFALSKKGHRQINPMLIIRKDRFYYELRTKTDTITIKRTK